MAKGKHAAALFEVIHSDRRFGKKTPPARALATPKWWFKGKPAPTIEAPAASTGSSSIPANGPVPLAPEPIDYMPSIAAERPVDVRLDGDRQQISFKLTYTSAAVGAFALVVVLSLAYIIGRKVNAGPASAVAATVSTSDLRKRPPQTGVLDLAKARSNAEGIARIAPDGDESANIVEPTSTGRAPAPAPPPPVNTAPPAPFSGKRLINQNYVIIQGFPPEEKTLADEAVAKLTEGRVGATLERGIGGYPSTWYIVVGTIPFERTKNNPVYDAYIQSIMNVSAKYAGKSQFKKFAPYAKKWAGDA